MIIGMTGTRAGASPQALEQLRRIIEHYQKIYKDDISGVHGGAVGADQQFNNIMKEYGSVQVYLPKELVSKEYLKRNRQIVDSSNIMLALPNILMDNPEPIRSGTYATIRYARKKNKPLIIIYPTGQLKFENFPE